MVQLIISGVSKILMSTLSYLKQEWSLALPKVKLVRLNVFEEIICLVINFRFLLVENENKFQHFDILYMKSNSCLPDGVYTSDEIYLFASHNPNLWWSPAFWRLKCLVVYFYLKINQIVLFYVWNLVQLTAFSDVNFHKYSFSMNPDKKWYSQHSPCRTEIQEYLT